MSSNAIAEVRERQAQRKGDFDRLAQQVADHAPVSATEIERVLDSTSRTPDDLEKRVAEIRSRRDLEQQARAGEAARAVYAKAVDALDALDRGHDAAEAQHNEQRQKLFDARRLALANNDDKARVTANEHIGKADAAWQAEHARYLERRRELIVTRRQSLERVRQGEDAQSKLAALAEC
jgi:hypothetical protein